VRARSAPNLSSPIAHALARSRSETELDELATGFNELVAALELRHAEVVAASAGVWATAEVPMSHTKRGVSNASA